MNRPPRYRPPRRNPWDRPVESGAPNRIGDREDTPIFTALGRAVSAWEGVNAVTSGWFYALLLNEDREEAAAEIAAFAGVQRVHDRAKQIATAAATFLSADFDGHQHEATALDSEAKATLAAYRGWAERRNDLAHGYVTQAETADPTAEAITIITNFALCPSHARHAKWPNAEPEFNYIASEINDFAARFVELDERIDDIAQRFEALRAVRKPKQAPPVK